MRKRAALVLAVLAVCLAGGSASQAAPAAPDVYTLAWWTVDAGGGTSRAGAYAVSGTTGQPDSGTTMSGGTYTLDGGFWNNVVQGLSGYRPFDLWLPISRR